MLLTLLLHAFIIFQLCLGSCYWVIVHIILLTHSCYIVGHISKSVLKFFLVLTLLHAKFVTPRSTATLTAPLLLLLAQAVFEWR